MVFCCFGGNLEKDPQSQVAYAMSNLEQRGNNINKLYPSLSEMTDIEGNEITPTYFKRSSIGKCTVLKNPQKSEILGRCTICSKG